MTNLPRDPRAEEMRYDAWSETHGLKKNDLDQYLNKLSFLLDNPKYTSPDYKPPESVPTLFKFGQMMESEIIRVMEAGPPYHPKMSLDGSMTTPHIHMFYPREWVDWMKALGLKDPQITMDMWNTWQPLVDEVIAFGEGDLFSNYPFALNEPGWTLMIPSLLAILLEPDLKPPFSTRPARIKVTDTDTLSLALVGDVGTGSWIDGDQPCPADAIMEQFKKLDLDYTIHLGDVYFLGASPFIEKFVETWVPGRRRSFNLNSNHDMYAWAKGYFEHALTDPKFAAQQGTGYFSIEFGNWIIVGLDTAYYDDSVVFFAGTLRDPAQKAFFQDIRRQIEMTGQKVVLLTHHLGLAPNGTQRMKLWGEIAAEDALGRDPDYWYWGHLHNGIVYSSFSASGEGTRCRCYGNGGIPRGAPFEFDEYTGENKPIQWYAQKSYDDDLPEQRKRVMNGFATLTFTENEVVETYYHQNGELVEIV